jgi:hypothetical protein
MRASAGNFRRASANLCAGAALDRAAKLRILSYAPETLTGTARKIATPAD